MTNEQKKIMAMETYELVIGMSKTFANREADRDYMILAIMACISGLTNKSYSLIPVAELNGEHLKSLRKKEVLIIF